MTIEEIQRTIGAIVMDACATLGGTDAVYSDLRKQIIDAKADADFWRRAYNAAVADFNELSEKCAADGGKAGVK